jgi:hypothetical protein
MRTKLIRSVSLVSIVTLIGCGIGHGKMGCNSDNGNGGSTANNLLSSLSISPGTLSPPFASGTTDYTFSVENSVTAVTVIPTAKDSGTTIKVTVGQTSYDVTSGASQSITLNGTDPTMIIIDVTGSDGTTTDTYTVTVTRAAAGTDIGDIGGACQCTDLPNSKCHDTLTGNTLPAGGDIANCNVPSGIAGAVKLCLRSFNSSNQSLYPSTYFANGYCSLGTTKCSLGNLCSFGTYDDMVACPSGSVMVTDSTTILGGAVSLNEKVCAKSCSDDNDCRTADGYTCSVNSDKCANNTAKFCYDARNLTNKCVVTKF